MLLRYWGQVIGWSVLTLALLLGVGGLPDRLAAWLAMLPIVGALIGSRRSVRPTALPGIFVAAMYVASFNFTAMGPMPLVRMPTGVMVGLTMALVLAMLVWAYRRNSDPDTPMEETPDECWTLGGDLQESQRSGDICAEAGWVRLHDQLGNVWSYVVLGGFTLGAIGLAAWLKWAVR